VETELGIHRLSAMEAPEAFFYDHLEVRVGEQSMEARVRLDARFAASVELDSVTVCACVPDRLMTTAARVTHGLLHVYTEPGPVTVQVMVKGVRRGFANRRFPQATREEMERSHALWQQINGYRQSA
jgi:hypothetical protein